MRGSNRVSVLFIGLSSVSPIHEEGVNSGDQAGVPPGKTSAGRLLSLLTEVEAEFHPPQAGVTEVGAAEGIPKVEGEFLAGDIADIQSC